MGCSPQAQRTAVPHRAIGRRRVKVAPEPVLPFGVIPQSGGRRSSNPSPATHACLQPPTVESSKDTRTAALERIFTNDEQPHRTREQLCQLAADSLLGASSRLKDAQCSQLPVPKLTSVHQVQVGKPPGPPQSKQERRQERQEDFYANVGDAIRTLREDVPTCLKSEISYDIYRDDITFCDPRNTFYGLDNYKLIFWSLRFHGNLFFKELYVEVKRIWQKDDDTICLRWKVHGFPRLPWDQEGTFDGVSTYKLDCHGKIYEHRVNNVIMSDPPLQKIPFLIRLSLERVQQPLPSPACPMPTPFEEHADAWFESVDADQVLLSGGIDS